MMVVAERLMTISPTVSGDGEPERRDELMLAALPSAVNLVRLLVRHDLADWLYDDLFIRRVELVAGILAGHAVATTGITEIAPFYSEVFDDLRVIVVRLRAFDDRVVVEMWDQASASADPSLGRKLAEAGTEAWDYGFPLPGHRVVWCTVVAEPSLPRRVPSAAAHPVPAASVDPRVDTAFLRRVLDGLQRRESIDRFDGDEPAP